MSKVYLSYASPDRDVALKISEALKETGHEITIDVDNLLPGQDISTTLFDNLRYSDFMVVIISEASASSKWVMSEIGAALAYSAERSSFGLIPVVIGNPEIPDTIKHKLYIQSSTNDINEIIIKIIDSISKLRGKREALKQKGEILKNNTDNYIKETINNLEKKQLTSKRIYYAWNVIGFLTLIVSTAFLITKLPDLNVKIETQFLIVALFKTTLIVSFLIACSRYSFIMGKIALDESITLGERIHAISFGKVFIQMFSEDFTKDEMYKVFENWNISPKNGAEQYKAEDYDPNLLKILTELIKVIKK